MGCISSSPENKGQQSNLPDGQANRPATIPVVPHSTFSGDGTNAALFRIDLPEGDPNLAKNTYMFSLLATQSNQISGHLSDQNEHNIAQDYDPSISGVCRLCNNLATDRCPPGLNPIIRGFLSDFEQAATGGCDICSLIIESVAPYTGPGRLKAYINPGLALNIIVKTADKNSRYDLFTAIGEPPSPWSGIGQARTIAPHSEITEVTDLLRIWLKDCYTRHSHCKPTGSAPFTPTRLIHLQDRHQVYLATRPEPGVSYTALSHRWANANLIPRTTSRNITSLRETIEWTSLSKTFRDAMEVSYDLGIKYIWIDSLCIIQDDKKDWEIEAAKMAPVYENAVFVLSAASAKDGSEGLFGPRKPVEILASSDTPTSSTVRVESQSRTITRDRGYGTDGSTRYLVRDTARHDQWDRLKIWAEKPSDFNPLLSRAWAFQERLLASRIVHFGDHELVWECHDGQRCECTHLDGAGSLPILERDSHDVRRSFSRVTRAAQQHPELNPFHIWMRVVELYNVRALTFETDRLPALAGAAAKLSALVGGSYDSGLLINDFPQCLLWSVPEPGVRHDPFYAPTWSWASVVMPTQKPNRAQYRSSAVAQGLVQLGRHMTIQSKGGKDTPALLVKGHAIRVTFSVMHFDRPTMTDTGGWDAVYHGAPLRTYSYSVCRDGKKASFVSDLILHEGLHKLEEGSELLLLVTARSTAKPYADCLLVLKRLDNADDFQKFVMTQEGLAGKSYARLGMMNLGHVGSEEGSKWLRDTEISTCILI
ncbi:uncharacterized protein DNG_03176 [Cephalotrichum gorgonifer]|uniref:Heterokaryon incompatibility domain-containing protein n=1 Tax=Cephalotrichum gorgonifer TaxID=2041049 RepID=A0AAE8MTR3_9PEZI|nr:uncharacterized protein DNG_03176 [Cephalotrichum gorgonifer]